MRQLNIDPRRTILTRPVAHHDGLRAERPIVSNSGSALGEWPTGVQSCHFDQKEVLLRVTSLPSLLFDRSAISVSLHNKQS